MARPAGGGHFSPALAGVFTLLVVYASLHPLSGWHDSGASPFAFLAAGWPRYPSYLDFTVNVAGYLPLGFLWVPANMSHLVKLPAVAVAVVLGSALSLVMEVTQNYLPGRVPSNLDWACNSLGALVGALAGAKWGPALLDGGRIHDWRMRRVAVGRMGDLGVVLAGLWLFTQFDPTTLLFGNGDLRGLLGMRDAFPYLAQGFARVEAILVGAHTLALGLLFQGLFRERGFASAAVVVGAGIAAKTLVFAVAMGPDHALAWATPGSLAGLSAGILLWLVCARLMPWLRLAAGAMALLAATVLVNLAPNNPYLVHSLQVWTPGHFFHFHGATSLVASAWPFLALAWLTLSRRPADEIR